MFNLIAIANKLIRSIAPARGTDGFGSGDFGASRGKRTHSGIDLCVAAESEILSTVSGVVTRCGYPYQSDRSYRYIEITDYRGYRHRFFYVDPVLRVGDYAVAEKTIIGIAQNISAKYSSESKVMKNHVHYEILTGDTGGPVDPAEFWGAS